ncbi:hypothetical protein OFB93_31120, partial [Escherichia coli]|nr:hypothetical protein [Escherichia coli]
LVPVVAVALIPTLTLTSTTASVPSIAISSAPRAILLLLVHLFGLGNLDFTLATTDSMEFFSPELSSQGLPL